MPIWNMKILEEFKNQPEVEQSAFIPELSIPSILTVVNKSQQKPHWIEAEELEDAKPPPPNPNSEEAVEERFNEYLAEIELRKFRHYSYREKGIMER